MSTPDSRPPIRPWISSDTHLRRGAPLDFAGWLRVAACLSVRTPAGKQACLDALELTRAVYADAEERHLVAIAEAANRGDTTPARAYLDALDAARREVEALREEPESPAPPEDGAVSPSPEGTLPGGCAGAFLPWPLIPPNPEGAPFDPALAPRAPAARSSHGADETMILPAPSGETAALPFAKGPHPR